MAWIELHQSLPTHRKARALSRLLGFKVPRDMPRTVGHVCMFWLWSIDNAPDGSLAGIDPQDIADAAMWGGDAHVFLDALMQSGFVDDDLCIHDWHMYIGKLIDRREDNARRNREARMRKKCDGDMPRAHHVCITSASRDDMPSASRDGATEPNRTQPYPTVPNPTEPTTRVTPPIAPHAGGGAVKPEPKAEPLQSARFGEFWDMYPKKQGKGAADKAYAKLRPDRSLHMAILKALTLQKQSPQWRKDNGQYIPNPATWLNQRRWEDEVQTGRPQSTGNVFLDILRQEEAANDEG